MSLGNNWPITDKLKKELKKQSEKGRFVFSNPSCLIPADCHVGHSDDHRRRHSWIIPESSLHPTSLLTERFPH